MAIFNLGIEGEYSHIWMPNFAHVILAGIKGSLEKVVFK
jgi:hypothetical protein